MPELIKIQTMKMSCEVYYTKVGVLWPYYRMYCLPLLLSTLAARRWTVPQLDVTEIRR